MMTARSNQLRYGNRQTRKFNRSYLVFNPDEQSGPDTNVICISPCSDFDTSDAEPMVYDLSFTRTYRLFNPDPLLGPDTWVLFGDGCGPYGDRPVCWDEYPFWYCGVFIDSELIERDGYIVSEVDEADVIYTDGYVQAETAKQSGEVFNIDNEEELDRMLVGGHCASCSW